MQTKEQCLEKVAEMAAHVSKHIRKKAVQLLNSGAIEPGEYEDNYRLPKIILVACLEHEAYQWGPLDGNKADKRAIVNLRHF